MADLIPLPDGEISQEELDTWMQNLFAKLSQNPDYQLFLKDGNVLSVAALYKDKLCNMILADSYDFFSVTTL